MTESHATEPVAEPPPPIDWKAAVERIAERSRPVREAKRADKEARQRLIDSLRADRIKAVNRDRSARQIAERFTRFADAIPDHPAVRAWAVDVSGRRTTDSLVLMGAVGTGKTHQAVGAWRVIAERTGCRAVAVTVPALLDSLRPSRPTLVDYAEVERADLLLLDDFAAERDSDWTVEVLYRLIDARYASMRPTIITTNVGAGLRERLGDRIASRLNGMGRVVVLDGPDRRALPRT